MEYNIASSHIKSEHLGLYPTASFPSHAPYGTYFLSGSSTYGTGDIPGGQGEAAPSSFQNNESQDDSFSWYPHRAEPNYMAMDNDLANLSHLFPEATSQSLSVDQGPSGVRDKAGVATAASDIQPYNYHQSQPPYIAYRPPIDPRLEAYGAGDIHDVYDSNIGQEYLTWNEQASAGLQYQARFEGTANASAMTNHPYIDRGDANGTADDFANWVPDLWTDVDDQLVEARQAEQEPPIIVDDPELRARLGIPDGDSSELLPWSQ